MDNIKEYIEQALGKITGNDDLLDQFKSDPVAAVKAVLGSEVGQDIIEGVVAAVKAKLGEGKLGGIADKIVDLLDGE